MRVGTSPVPNTHPGFDEKLDRFAELLSLDIPIPRIAERMGIGRGAAYNLLAKLREKFGWQSA